MCREERLTTRAGPLGGAGDLLAQPGVPGGSRATRRVAGDVLADRLVLLFLLGLAWLSAITSYLSFRPCGGSAALVADALPLYGSLLRRRRMLAGDLPTFCLSMPEIENLSGRLHREGDAVRRLISTGWL